MIDGAGWSWPLLGAGLLALGALAWASVWLAGRTRRRLNSGLVLAAAAVVAALVTGTAFAMSAASTAQQVRNNRVQGALSLTAIRSAAYDARSNESLGLIARGQAAPYEAQVKLRQTQISADFERLGRLTWPAGSGTLNDVTNPWSAYVEAHKLARSLDDKGDWDGAVAAVTGAAGGPTVTFSAFDKASAAALGQFDQSLQQEINAPQGQLAFAAFATALLGLGAAAATRRGFAARTKEYE